MGKTMAISRRPVTLSVSLRVQYADDLTIGISTTEDVFEIMNAMQGEGNAHVIYALLTKQSTTFKYNDKILSEGSIPMISHFINFSCADDRVALNDVSIPNYTKLPDAYYFCTVIIQEPTQMDPCWTKL